MDSLVVAPGTTGRARFIADAPGTYWYAGSTTGDAIGARVLEDSQLNGALVVDPAPGAPPPHERILLMSMWAASRSDDGIADWRTETFAINGRPWPLTERFTYDLGDTVRWRVINATEAGHPMHLHGFYFRVDAKGDMARDEIYWPSQRRLAATEMMDAGETVDMTFVPDRPGGWPFHCHIVWHVAANAAIGQYAAPEERDADLLTVHPHADPHRHVEQGMGGLMIGFYVRPPEGWRPMETAERAYRLFVQSDSIAGERRRYGFLLGDGDQDPPPDSIAWPGSTIVAWKGEPTSVTVLNRTAEPTQIHWHGLEIDSYYDGVAGIGGYPGSATPAILPGDSFVMRITPPRAGSFMYHTHLMDIRQQSAGMYGGFVVLDPGETWDPAKDIVMLLSTNNDPTFQVLLNGSLDPDPIVLRAGTTVRFRLMNITLHNAAVRVRLLREGYPVQWRPLAKDGAEGRRSGRVRADQQVSVGETYDFEYFAPEAGELLLEVRAGDGTRFVDQIVRIIEAEAPAAATGR
jgi:FtsP/CotA-like multicopper oxidase with cupredoxin domain